MMIPHDNDDDTTHTHIQTKVFEFGGDYARGTLRIAESLAELGRNGGITIVGGGDSVAAVEGSGLGEGSGIYVVSFGIVCPVALLYAPVTP